MNISIRIDAKSLFQAAKVLVPLVAVGTVGIASAGQVVFQPDQLLTAADLNANFGDLDDRLATVEANVSAPPIITEWVPFTPTVTVNGTNIAVQNVDGNNKTGLWRRVGDSVEVMIDVGMTCSQPGFFELGLPPGLAIDPDRSMYYTAIGGGLTVNLTASTHTTRVVIPITDTTVGMVAPPYSVNVGCSDLGAAGGHVRMHYTVAIEGWGVSD